MNNALVNLMATQFRQYFREPQVLFWSFGFPLLLIWLLGLSFADQDIKVREVGVVAPTHDSRTREEFRAWSKRLESQEQALSAVINADEDKRTHLIKTKYRFKFYENRDEVVRALKRGDISIFVEKEANSSNPVYYLDPHNSEALLTYFFLEDDAQAISQATRKNLSILSSPGLRYIDFLLPGLLAMVVMQTCLIAVGWTLIEKRVAGVTRQMRITPMKKHHFLAAHLLACFVFNFVEVFIIYLFAHSLFDVAAQGGVAPFILLVVAGNVCFSGIAVLAASRAMKAQTANGILEVTILLLIIFSGIFFSYRTFPEWLISIVEVLPLTILADSMRTVFIEGAGVMDVAQSVFVLTAIGVITFLAGLKVFKWY